MCGIFGVVKKKSEYSYVNSTDLKQIKDLFESLAESSIDRGRDSTGVFLARLPTHTSTYYDGNSTTIKNKGAKLYVIKDKIRADEFIKTDKFKEVMNKINNHTYALVGHTRACSSAGPQNNANNHPHICGDVVGIHNGNIHNWKELASMYNIKMRGGCDSEVIFGLINKFVKEDHMTMTAAIQRAASVMNGTYACAVMSSLDTSKLYLFRSSAPIKLRYKKIDSLVIFASEARFIREAYAKTEKGSTCNNYYDMSEIVIPDRQGLILDNGKNQYGSWVEKAEYFKLDS